MSTEEKVARFERQITGYEAESDLTVTKYSTWAERFEDWKPEGEPALGMLRDFDRMLHDPDQTDYPWDTSGPGRPAPDSYSFESRKAVMSAIKRYSEVIYGAPIRKKPSDICFGSKEEFDPEYLPHSEIERIIEKADSACANPGCEAAIRLSYDAILRGVELARVRVEDVSMNDQTVKVRAAKGSVQATLGISSPTFESIVEYVDGGHPGGEYLFHNSNGTPWSKAGPNSAEGQAWNNHFRKIHHPEGSHCCFRHSAIVNRIQHPEWFDDMDEEKDPFGQVFRRARHGALTTTIQYAKVVDSDPPEYLEENA